MPHNCIEIVAMNARKISLENIYSSFAQCDELNWSVIIVVCSILEAFLSLISSIQVLHLFADNAYYFIEELRLNGEDLDITLTIFRCSVINRTTGGFVKLDWAFETRSFAKILNMDDYDQSRKSLYNYLFLSEYTCSFSFMRVWNIRASRTCVLY